MRKLLFAGVTLALCVVGSAKAADLPAEAVYKGGPLIVPVYDWTGFYAGISGGYSRGDAANTYTGFASLAGSTHMNGGVFGGQAGFNWQANRNFVVGLEADLQGTWQNGTDSRPGVSATTCTPIFIFLSCTTTTNTIGVDQKLRWFGTARARVGFLPWDHVMLFVTGGAAFGEVESNATVTNAVTTAVNGIPGLTTTTFASGTAINRHGGWTVGGGSEWVLSGPWTAKLEYLFVDLGTVTNTFLGSAVVPTVVATSHVRDNIIRIGINYRFGGPVANY